MAMNDWLASQIRPLTSGLAVACLVLAACAWGFLFVNRFLRLSFRHPSDRLLVTMPIGLGMLSLIFLGAGSLKILNPVTAWMFTVLSALPGLWLVWESGLIRRKSPGKEEARALRPGPGRRQKARTGQQARSDLFAGVRAASWRRFVFYIPMAMYLFYSLAMGFCLPTGWDDLTYHIALPLRWTHDQAPLVYTDNPYSGFPSAQEFIFWALYLMGGITAPRLFVWVLFGWTTLALHRLLRPGLSFVKAAFLTSSLMLMPLAGFMIFKETYVEPLMLLVFVSGLLICRRVVKPGMPWRTLALCAFAGAMLAGIKLTGVFPAAALFLMSPWVRSAPPSKLPLRVLCYASIAFFCALPFYLRPWLTTGNPFHPYFAWLISSDPGYLQCSAFHHAMGSVKFGFRSLPDFVLNLLRLALPLNDSENKFDGSFGWQWPALLALAALAIRNAIVSKGSRGLVFSLLLASLFLYAAWFFSSQQARFLLPLLPLVGLLAAQALRRISKPKPLAFCLTMLMALSLYSIPVVILKCDYVSWKCLLGRHRPVDYVYAGTEGSYLQAVEISRELLPPDARLMLFFDERILYFKNSTLIGTPFFQSGCFTPPPKPENGTDTIISVLQKYGVTHILVCQKPPTPDWLAMRQKEVREFLDLLESMAEKGILQEVWRDPHYVLFRFNAPRLEKAYGK